MTAQSQNETILPASDLSSAINYKEALTYKVDELLNKCKVEKMETRKDECIEGLLRDTALRRNITKPYNLDQRCKSPANYEKKGFLKGTEGTLEENLIPDLDVIEKYHDEQHKLFDALAKKFPGTLFLADIKQEQDKNGRWFLYRSGKKFTTIQFLNFVDKITLRYIEELKVLDVTSLTPSGIKKKEDDLESVASFCEIIVMARYLDQLTTDTDFMKNEEIKFWKNHVAVILSFAALLVILEMMRSKLRPKLKRKRLKNEIIFPVAVVGLGVMYCWYQYIKDRHL